MGLKVLVDMALPRGCVFIVGKVGRKTSKQMCTELCPTINYIFSQKPFNKEGIQRFREKGIKDWIVCVYLVQAPLHHIFDINF